MADKPNIQIIWGDEIGPNRTAGRAAFIIGQNPYRTGLTEVGVPCASPDFSHRQYRARV